jgi:phosphatidylinositol glycan class M
MFPFLRSPLISFVPQMTLSLGTGLLFGRRKEDLPFTWFVQTAVFVLFNKVCTSQASRIGLSNAHTSANT